MTIPQLASELRPALLRLTRIIRGQRVDRTLSLTQMSALTTLGRRGAMSAGELAACECVQPSSMTKVLAALEKNGLVRRAVHPIDRRQAIIALTAAGRRLLEAERRSRDEWLSRRLALLSEDEQALLHQVAPILHKLSEM